MRPPEPSRSPTRTSTDDKSTRWRDSERRTDKKDVRGRVEEVEYRSDRGAVRGMERRGDHAPEATASESRRGKDQRDVSPPPISGGPEGRDFPCGALEEGKKKHKSLKIKAKKSCNDDDSAEGSRDVFNTETSAPLASSENPNPLISPPKSGKKKCLERKRRRSRGADSDQSEDEQPMGKRHRGPRTPPQIKKEGLPSQRGQTLGHATAPPLKMETNFSDWSDEEVPERTEILSERLPERLLPRRNVAPLLPDPPMLMQNLPLQPLLPQHMLRKPQQVDPHQQRSSSMGSNSNRPLSHRLRSPSNDSTHRGDEQGPRSRRARGQGANSRDRERERVTVTEPMGGREERKSRIDQLRRGEPSRSTSSGNAYLLYIYLFLLNAILKVLFNNLSMLGINIVKTCIVVTC